MCLEHKLCYQISGLYFGDLNCWKSLFPFYRTSRTTLTDLLSIWHGHAECLKVKLVLAVPNFGKVNLSTLEFKCFKWKTNLDNFELCICVPASIYRHNSFHHVVVLGLNKFLFVFAFPFHMSSNICCMMTRWKVLRLLEKYNDVKIWKLNEVKPPAKIVLLVKDHDLFQKNSYMTSRNWIYSRTITFQNLC